MTNIYMDYEDARRQAAQLKEIAAEIRQVSNSALQGVFEDLQTAWKGEAAEAFFQKELKLEQDIEKMANKVQEIAQAVERIAAQFLKAEQEAIALAQSR